MRFLVRLPWAWRNRRDAGAEACPPPAGSERLCGGEHLSPSRRQARSGPALTILLALILVGAVALLGPRAVDAAYLLLHQDDPVALAEHAVRRTLDPAAARREIEAALAANDPELVAGVCYGLSAERLDN